MSVHQKKCQFVTTLSKLHCGTISGFIYHSEIVQTVPPDLRRKVARVVGDKCTLASRVDAQHESKVGN